MMTDSEAEKRFEGAGQEFHAKYMGCVEVAKNKGQEVCQEAMQKLLVALKARKEPKPRLTITLSFEGTRLKEMPPGINLLDLTFKHTQVSYVWKDPRDQRSLGIVRSEPDPEDATKVVHKFHGIRTVKPAMPFLQEMQELFRIVKERASQQKERSASMASAAPAAETVPAAAVADSTAAPQQPPQAQTTATDDARNRAVSNLLGPDQSDLSVPAGLPKNESVASLDDLGDIFSASATIGQQQQPPFSPIGQPMGMAGGPFAQPMTGGPFAQPMGGQFGQPASPFGQPGNPFGQPIGAVGSPYGQPMPAGGLTGPQYRPPPQATNPFGLQQQQPPMMAPGMSAYPAYAAAPASPYGRPAPPQFTAQMPHQQPQQQQQLFYQQQQPQQQTMRQPPATTNPFESGFTSVFDRQNSVPAGGNPMDDLLTPVALSPTPTSPAPAAKPDAFSNLVVGLTPADPKRQQVSGKDLFKPVDKPKATLRDLANQSPRPGP